MAQVSCPEGDENARRRFYDLLMEETHDAVGFPLEEEQEAPHEPE